MDTVEDPLIFQVLVVSFNLNFHPQLQFQKCLPTWCISLTVCKVEQEDNIEKSILAGEIRLIKKDPPLKNPIHQKFMLQQCSDWVNLVIDFEIRTNQFLLKQWSRWLLPLEQASPVKIQSLNWRCFYSYQRQTLKTFWLPDY